MSRVVQRTREDPSTGHNLHEGIEIVWVRTVQPVHEQVCRTAFGGRENLQCGLGSTVASHFTANDENATIGHDHRSWVPTPPLFALLSSFLLWNMRDSYL